MPATDDLLDDAAGLATEIAQLAQQHRLTVAVAESLTGGKVACHLAAAPEASQWFRGGVVAYSAEVKHDVLGVPAGPVVSESCAEAMATGVAKLLDATLAVATTGVGGPGPQDGEAPGTVWLAVASEHGVTAQLQHFAGEPPDVLDQTVRHALRLLRDMALAAG